MTKMLAPCINIILKCPDCNKQCEVPSSHYFASPIPLCECGKFMEYSGNNRQGQCDALLKDRIWILMLTTPVGIRIGVYSKEKHANDEVIYLARSLHQKLSIETDITNMSDDDVVDLILGEFGNGGGLAKGWAYEYCDWSKEYPQMSLADFAIESSYKEKKSPKSSSSDSESEKRSNVMKKIIGFEALENRVSLESAIHLSKLFNSEIERGYYSRNLEELVPRSLQISNLLEMALIPLGKRTLRSLKNTIDDLVENGSFCNHDVSYVEDLKKHYGVNSLIVLEDDIDDFTMEKLERKCFLAKSSYYQLKGEIENIHLNAHSNIYINSRNSGSKGEDENIVKCALEALEKLISEHLNQIKLNADRK